MSLSDMENLFPAWDMDINRHMVMELARRRERTGPTWALSMFPFERMWKRLIDWMKQVTHPEATITRSFMAYRTVLDFMTTSDENPQGEKAFLFCVCSASFLHFLSCMQML